MKKIALTFVAVAFGSCIAFAQTNPETEETKTVNTEESLTIDRLSDKPEEAGRRMMNIEELPEAVQQALKDGEFKGWQVVSVTEVQAQDDKENLSNTEVATETDAPATAAVQYEVALVSEDMQDEIEDSQAATEEVKEEAAEEGIVAEEKMVTVKVPGVVVRFDEQGNVVSRVEQPADDQNEE